MNDLEIITTSDGSHTIRNTALNETYHSIHGAIQESMHVFILNGLQEFHLRSHQSSISVLEVGFGTGLNAFLTLEYAQRHNISVRYTSLEPFPLSREFWLRLNYGGSDNAEFLRIHETPWDVAHALSPNFTILKRKASLQEVFLESVYDVVYFDAFAPAISPELWTLQSLRKSTEKITHGGVFVTYSAKGQVKRDLRDLGGTVETLPGPPGKREMVRAVFT